jgi:hypothetical protein
VFTGRRFEPRTQGIPHNGISSSHNGISASHNRIGSTPRGWSSFGISGNDLEGIILAAFLCIHMMIYLVAVLLLLLLLEALDDGANPVTST